MNQYFASVKAYFEKFTGTIFNSIHGFVDKVIGIVLNEFSSVRRLVGTAFIIVVVSDLIFKGSFGVIAYLVTVLKETIVTAGTIGIVAIVIISVALFIRKD